MKLLTLYVILFMLMMLSVACSQSKHSTKSTLQLSSFNLSAAGYTGGLVVTGESSKGKFTATSINGSSIRIELQNATWKFKVVTWDGMNLFTGTARCGSTTQAIDSSNSAVSITVRTTDCSNSEFGPRFKHLKIFNCSALLDSNEVGITTSTIPSLFETNFCDDNASLDPSQQDSAGYLKIKIPGNLNNGANYPDLESPCLETGNNPLATYELPLLIPIIITLSNSSDCSSPIEHVFPNGISGANKPISSLVNLHPTTYNALFIPFQAKAPAQLLSLLIYDSSGNLLPEKSILTPGDVVTIKMTASEPNGEPIEYKFYRAGLGLTTIQDWSSNNEATYTVSSSDLGLSGLKLYGAIRNNDGINYTNSAYYGDAQDSWAFTAPGSYRPAQISNLIVTSSSGNVLPSGSIVSEGDTLNVSAMASDPNSLPMEYVFYKAGPSLTAFQTWGTVSSTRYTVSAADIGISGLKLYGAVRNNDGIDFTNSSLYGDGQKSWSFEASGSFLPAELISLVVKDINGTTLPSSAVLTAGQKITLELTASDPKGLPIEYIFYREGSGLRIFLDWSSTNIATYTVTSEDLGISGVKIYGAVRNNDGKNYTNSPYYGDQQKSWSFTAQ